MTIDYISFVSILTYCIIGLVILIGWIWFIAYDYNHNNWLGIKSRSILDLPENFKLMLYVGGGLIGSSMWWIIPFIIIFFIVGAMIHGITYLLSQLVKKIIKWQKQEQ